MTRPPQSPGDAVRRLSAQLDRVSRAPSPDQPVLLRLREPIAPSDLLAWLAAQPGRIKGYWVDRDGGLEVAALGEADEIKGEQAGDYAGCWQALRARWPGADPDTRYYGGFRFGPWHPKDPSWRPFQAYRFILPEFELIRRADGACELVCNLFFQPGRDPVDAARATLQQMQFPSAFQPNPVGATKGRHDMPDRDYWMRAVEEALGAIRAGRLEKVVLARRVCFELERAVDAFTLIHRMREESGRCYQFCGVHEAGVAFVGASPERLYQRIGRRLRSEAVAGTRSRGAGADADAALGTELLASVKDQQEHRLVVEGIRAALTPLSKSVHHDAEPALLKLARLQHLVTRVEAELREGVDDPAVLRALHPTPAVGGKPAGAALDWLARVEPFDRGWYTGPVGWVSPDAAEFAVALRCGLAAGSRLCLFSGAGIVADSDPASEWDEIESKLSTFLAILRSA